MKNYYTKKLEKKVGAYVAGEYYEGTCPKTPLKAYCGGILAYNLKTNGRIVTAEKSLIAKIYGYDWLNGPSQVMYIATAKAKVKTKALEAVGFKLIHKTKNRNSGNYINFYIFDIYDKNCCETLEKYLNKKQGNA